MDVFFIFYMMVFSINPKLLPVKIYNSFSLITTVNDRGNLLILISNFIICWRKLYFLDEFLVPTTKEELE